MQRDFFLDTDRPHTRFSDAGPTSTTGGGTRTEARAGDPKTSKGRNRGRRGAER
jgi:hypothetical protein